MLAEHEAGSVAVALEAPKPDTPLHWQTATASAASVRTRAIRAEVRPVEAEQAQQQQQHDAAAEHQLRQEPRASCASDCR